MHWGHLAVQNYKYSAVYDSVCHTPLGEFQYRFSLYAEDLECERRGTCLWNGLGEIVFRSRPFRCLCPHWFGRRSVRKCIPGCVLFTVVSGSIGSSTTASLVTKVVREYMSLIKSDMLDELGLEDLRYLPGSH